MLRPMYYYGGIPATQEVYEAVFCADKLMNEAPKLAMCKRTVVVKGSPNDMITNPEGVVERLQARAQVQDNFGIWYVDRNTDVTQLETSLSDFDELIIKANQRIAAIFKMPETKLFKTQLAGMNSAGRYEWDDYAQLLINIQNNWYTPLLMMHFRLDTKSQNDESLQIRIEWNPIDVPTTQEKADSESRAVQTIGSAIQAGMMSPDEGRMILRSIEGSKFSALSVDNPVSEEQEQQQQGGGMPGGGGDGGGSPDGGGNPLAALLGGAGAGIGGGNGSPLEEPKQPKEPKAKEEKK